MDGKSLVRTLRWVAVNDEAVIWPELAKEAADYIEAALGIIATFDELQNHVRREGGGLLGRTAEKGKG